MHGSQQVSCATVQWPASKQRQWRSIAELSIQGGMDARPFAHPEHMMAELHDGFEPRGRLWLVMTHELGGHHDGTRAEVGHRSEVCYFTLVAL